MTPENEMHQPSYLILGSQNFVSECDLLTFQGMYTSEPTREMFVAETHCLLDLVKALSSSCPCGNTRTPWEFESSVQVIKVKF